MGAYFLKKQARSPILEGFGRNIYALLSFSGQQYFVIRCPKGTLYSHDRTESDNRIEVMLFKGMAENNLPHIVR